MKKGQLIFNCVIGVLVVTLFMLYLFPYGNKIGYIKTNEVFHDFTLKKELETNLETFRNKKNYLLDSLTVILKTKESFLNQEKNQELKKKRMEECYQLSKLLKERQQKLNEQEEQLTTNFNDQIFKQINQYSLEYGKKYGYRYIFGTTNDGNIMYAGESEDITKQVKEFINKRYQGAE